MKRLTLFLWLLATVSTYSLRAQSKYACFQNDARPGLQISIGFNGKGKAISVKYKGQRDSIPLTFISRTKEKGPDGGIPAYYWSETYQERFKGKVTGTYIFTNAGTYQLDVTYTRKKDNKDFYFAIIEGTFTENDVPFRSTPCF